MDEGFAHAVPISASHLSGVPGMRVVALFTRQAVLHRIVLLELLLFCASSVPNDTFIVVGAPFDTSS